MDFTPDQIVLWEWGALRLNATILWTWVVMALLVAGSWALARGLRAGVELSPGQNILEAIVSAIEGQIKDVSPVFTTDLLDEINKFDRKAIEDKARGMSI